MKDRVDAAFTDFLNYVEGLASCHSAGDKSGDIFHSEDANSDSIATVEGFLANQLNGEENYIYDHPIANNVPVTSYYSSVEQMNNVEHEDIQGVCNEDTGRQDYPHQYGSNAPNHQNITEDAYHYYNDINEEKNIMSCSTPYFSFINGQLGTQQLTQMDDNSSQNFNNVCRYETIDQREPTVTVLAGVEPTQVAPAEPAKVQTEPTAARVRKTDSSIPTIAATRTIDIMYLTQLEFLAKLHVVSAKITQNLVTRSLRYHSRGKNVKKNHEQ